MGNIYIFGDSITWGAFDEHGGWADRIKQDFMRNKLEDINRSTIQVVNLGISGNTANDIARRIESEIQARQNRWSSSADVYVVAVGVNDSRLKGDDKKPVSSPENYKEKLDEIVSSIRKYSQNILLVGLTPVVDEIFASPHDTVYQNARINEFNRSLKDFCASQKLPLVEIFESMQQLDWKELLPDGLHPNTEGHQWMYEQIKPKIMELMK